MTIIDERGRVFGRINLIDAAAALFLFVLIPVAYGAYLLFRAPPAKLIAVTPDKVYFGPNLRVQIRGMNLRPFMRVTFGTTQGLTFSIDSTTSAQVDLPDLPPGVYDVALFDFRQEVDRLPQALTILSLAPASFVQMDVSGSFKNLSDGSARQLKAGQTLATGNTTAEILRVGTPAPSTIRFTAGTSVLTLPVPGQLELSATLRVHCSTEVAGDASIRCMVPGLQRPVPVAPDSLLTLSVPDGSVNFQIASIAVPVDPTVVEVHVLFETNPEIAAMVSTGDTDASPVAYAGVSKATISAITARRGGTIRATLRVPAVRGSYGWMFNDQPLKAGLPLRLETAGYVINGQVTSLKAPPLARDR